MVGIVFSAAAAAQVTALPQIRVGVAAYTLPPVTVKVQSNLVPLQVVVRRSDGSVVPGLDRDRFRVSDDGHAETISQFSVVNHGIVAATAAGTAVRAAGGPAMSGAKQPPRYIALWFDDVNTGKGDLMHARNAALAFLQHGREPADRVGVFTASGSQHTGFTADSSVLSKAIASIRPHPLASANGIQDSCPRITPFQAYQIAVLHFQPAFDAALAEKNACDATPVDDLTGKSMLNLEPGAAEPILAQAEATWDRTRAIGRDAQGEIEATLAELAREPGKRILLLASGGFLAETLDAGQEKIINQALHAQVVINALDARGLYTEDPSRPLGHESDAGVLPLITFFYEQTSQLSAREAEDDGMVQLAQATGGLFFQNSNDLTLGFERLGLEPAVTYELAFVPASLPRDGKFHKLKIVLDPPVKGAVVQARRGYFDPAPDTPVSRLQLALDRSMRDAISASGVPASITLKPDTDGVGVDIHLDIARLPFVDQHGRHEQTVTVIAGLFSPDGAYVTGKRGVLDLALTGAGYKHFRAQGLGATLRLRAAAGSYRLRVVVGEASDARYSAFSRQITIR